MKIILQISKTIRVFGILIILSVTNCSKVNESLPLIDIEANTNNMQVVNLSEFADNIRYVQLEHNEKYLISGISHVDIAENWILLSGGDNCLLYDSEGNFVSKIGKRGRGPGEYSVAANIGFSGGENQKIYISTTYDLFEYDLNGSFIKKHTNSFLVNDIYYLRYKYIINDSLLFGFINNGSGNVEYKALIINKSGDVKLMFKNYVFFNNESGRAFEGVPDFFKFKGMPYFKEQFNDTLFSLNENYEPVPRYVFNLGSLKLPLSIRTRFPMGEIVMNYIFIDHIFQTENHLILGCNFGNRFPAKRLTSKPSIFPGGEPMWINTTGILGLFNKKTEELVFIKPSNTDNPLFTSGFYNDIDCGPRFFPQVMINERTMLMWVSPDRLKSHIASDDFKENIPKYPEKKKKLEKLADSLSVFDNPVLMFVTFKK